MRDLVKWASRNAMIVALLVVAVMLGGGYAFSHMPIDAVPDVTNVQVQVVTRVPALSASVVSARLAALPTRSVRRLMLPRVVGASVMGYPQSRYHPRHQHRPVRRCPWNWRCCCWSCAGCVCCGAAH